MAEWFELCAAAGCVIAMSQISAAGTKRQENIVWVMSWAPHETKMIRVSYEIWGASLRGRLQRPHEGHRIILHRPDRSALERTYWET